MSGKGFGRYLTDEHRAEADKRAEAAQEKRDERRREHETAMTNKRNKREADRAAEADKSHGASQLVTGAASNGEGGGSPLKTSQRRESNGRGFGKYLDS